MGLDIRKDTKLRIGVLGAEPWSDGMRDRIYESLGVKGINIYGTSELSGPLWCECEEQNGMHVWGDLALVEIVDPLTGKKVAPGRKGRTGHHHAAERGVTDHPVPDRGYHDGARGEVRLRTDAPRIGRISGRSDDMLIIRGINVFPSQIEYVLLSMPQLGNEFQIIVDRTGALDEMTVRVELKPEGFVDDMAKIEVLRDKIASKLRTTLMVNACIELVEPGTLPRFEGKAKRVIDKRKY